MYKARISKEIRAFSFGRGGAGRKSAENPAEGGWLRSGSAVKERPERFDKPPGVEAVAAEGADDLEAPGHGAMAQIDVFAVEGVQFPGRPIRGEGAGGVDGEVLGGGKAGFQGGEARVVRLEVVALAGGEVAREEEIELPAEAAVGEAFAHRDAAGGDPIEVAEARGGIELDFGVLDVP